LRITVDQTLARIIARNLSEYVSTVKAKKYYLNMDQTSFFNLHIWSWQENRQDWGEVSSMDRTVFWIPRILSPEYKSDNVVL